MKQPPAAGKIHPTQVRKAFGEDHEHPASLATFFSIDADTATLNLLDGTEVTVTVIEPDQFGASLKRRDVCRLNGSPLLLVNEWYRVIGVAVGPTGPPDRLEVHWGVSYVEDGSVVEIPSPDDALQPAWRVFALGPAAHPNDHKLGRLAKYGNGAQS